MQKTNEQILKDLEKTKKELQQHQKNMSSKKMTESSINQIMVWNRITSLIMFVILIVLFGIYVYFDLDFGLHLTNDTAQTSEQITTVSSLNDKEQQ